MNFKHINYFWCFLELFIVKFIPNINNEHVQDYSCPGATFAFCSHGEKLPRQGGLPGVVQRVTRLSKLPRGNEILMWTATGVRPYTEAKLTPGSVSSPGQWVVPESCEQALSKGVYWSEDKQTRNLACFDPANFEMFKIYQGNFQSSCRLAQLFPQSFYTKRAKSLETIFFQLWKCNLVDFIKISGNRCANTNIHWRKFKHPT